MAYFEIKYLVPLAQVQVLKQWLDCAYAGSDPYGEGGLDTLYFDTPSSAIQANSAAGNYEKIKVRMRSYDLKTYTQLQLKKKVGYRVSKIVVKVRHDIDSPIPPDFYADWGVPGEFDFPKPLVPRIRIIDRRSRYRTRNLRVTLDTEVRFVAHGSGLPYLRKEAHLPFGVLEVKSDLIKDALPEVHRWGLKHMPFSKFFLGESVLRNREDMLARYF